MTYSRVISRNRLRGNYFWDKANPPETPSLEMLIGDLRRLETDQRDEQHLAMYAKIAAITEAQAKIVLDTFYGWDY